MAPIPFQHLVAQEYFCATRNTYSLNKFMTDWVTWSTSYYKPHRKYHPDSTDLPFSLQNMEKTRTSKHILNTNTLQLLWTTGKDPIYSPYSHCALHSIFYHPRSKTTDSGRGAVPGGGFQRSWREEQSPGINCSCITWAELPFSSSLKIRVRDSDPADLGAQGGGAACWQN